MSDFELNNAAECLDVSVRPDGIDGSGNYKFVCTLKHAGHQSYGQSFGVYFSTDVSIVEVPGDIQADAEKNHIQIKRSNQMNSSGLVEIWIKLSAGTQPEVTGITDVSCQLEEGGCEMPVIGPVQQAIYARRSVRSYLPDMPPKSVLGQIMKAGTYAASGMNRQSPVIIAVTNKEVRNRLSALNAKIMGTPDTDPFYGAPAVIIVLADKTQGTYIYDGSLVIGNMMLAAQELGLGCCWVHRAKEEFAEDTGKEILDTLGITGSYEGIGHLILGYPDEEAKPAAPRKDNYIYFLE